MISPRTQKAPSTRPTPHGNRYFQLLVDAAIEFSCAAHPSPTNTSKTNTILSQIKILQHQRGPWSNATTRKTPENYSTRPKMKRCSPEEPSSRLQGPTLPNRTDWWSGASQRYSTLCRQPWSIIHRQNSTDRTPRRTQWTKPILCSSDK